jgi:hypothetical protein
MYKTEVYVFGRERKRTRRTRRRTQRASLSLEGFLATVLFDEGWFEWEHSGQHCILMVNLCQGGVSEWFITLPRENWQPMFFDNAYAE